MKLVGAAILSETANFQINYSVWSLHFATQRGLEDVVLCHYCYLEVSMSHCHVCDIIGLNNMHRHRNVQKKKLQGSHFPSPSYKRSVSIK